MPLLKLDNVSFSFPAKGDRTQPVEALRDISFDLREKEFVTLLGPSGCGKTSTLDLIAQILKPTSGRVEYHIDGIPELTPDTKKPALGGHCKIGYVTQEDNLLPWASVKENLFFPIVLQGKDRRDFEAKASELIDLVGLTQFQRHYPHELSGGMKKRLSLIRTLIYDPEIILMDEPFGPLDAQTRTHLQSELLRIWQNKKKAIVFVTHDIMEAITLSDRIILFSPRPGNVYKIYDDPIPRPRDVRRIVTTEAFRRLYETIVEDFHKLED